MNDTLQTTKVVFLDRDGVINQFPGDKDYVKTPDEFVLLIDVPEALKYLKENGFILIVISNQAGINKRLYTENDLKNITEKMHQLLAEKGVILDGVYYCPHRDQEECYCRKPKSGLLKIALKDIVPKNVRVAASFFIGDSEIDILTGRKSGCTTILVLSGKTKTKEEVKSWKSKPDIICENLKEAAEWILKQ